MAVQGRTGASALRPLVDNRPRPAASSEDRRRHHRLERSLVRPAVGVAPAVHSAAVSALREAADKKGRVLVFQDGPIYRQLVAERGDVLAQVRSEADRVS